MRDLCHDDFVFVDDYEKMTRDDCIEALRVQFIWGTALDFTRDSNIILDNRDIFLMQFTRDIDGVPHRISNVGLLSEGKFWRFQINCASV